MKRNSLQIAGWGLVICSVAAYTFLCFAQSNALDTDTTATISEQILRKLEPNAAPDVGLLKHFITVLVNLLPAS
jgi:hypothetical protein